MANLILAVGLDARLTAYMHSYPALLVGTLNLGMSVTQRPTQSPRKKER